jgi:hypothetical protein
MVRKGIILFGWFPLAVLFVFFCIFYLHHSSMPAPVTAYTGNQATLLSDSGNTNLTHKNGSGQVLGISIEPGDGRVRLLQNFMQDSPLTQYANLFVSEADKYGLDYRMVPAIAMCESNLGRHIPAHDSYNAWGIAVYTGQQNGAKWADWPTAIKWVNNFMYKKFIMRNIVDINDIGAIWAPPSVENGYSWSKCVENFMRKIE